MTIDASTGGLGFAGGVVAGVAADSAAKAVTEHYVGEYYDDVFHPLPKLKW